MRLVGGRYELGEEIGRGGMAQVHAAYDTRLGRRVAVKMLHAGRVGDKIFLSRFRREAQAAASLTHPNIVAVYDSGEDLVETTNGSELVPFIVMELVQGRTLSQIMHDEGTLSINDAIAVTEGVLAALGYSAAHGVVHRDIKPGNVMLTPNGDIKVMDFGIARGGGGDVTATMTQTQSVVGTAQYLSPEQARGLDVDGRSDLYSAGCLLFELVTGRPPFVGDSPLAIAYQHVGEDPATPSTYNPAIPESLDAVILHALIKDRDRRYQSADAFASDLRAVRLGEPLSPAAHATAAAAFTPTEAIGEPLPPVVEAVPAPQPEPATGSHAAEVPTPVVTTDPVTGSLPAAVGHRRRSPLAWLLPLLLVLAALGAGYWWWTHRTPEVAKYAVPAVVGKTEAQARALIESAGLKADITQGESSYPAGQVFDQNPSAGTMQPENLKVAISVSTGPSSVKVPQVQGMLLDSAKTSLTNAGLKPGLVVTADSATVPVNGIVKTEPAADTSVPTKTPITLYVSSGKIGVPNVEGMLQPQATKALTDAKLQPIFKQQPTSDFAPGTIISQDIKNTSVAPGSSVTLTVAAEPPTPVPTVTVTRTTTATATIPVPVPVPAPTRTRPTVQPTTDLPAPTTAPEPTRTNPIPTTIPTPTPT